MPFSIAMSQITRGYRITSLRMIPTMTFIHVLTGKSSGILSDISSGILSGILSGISSGICSGISSGILSGKSSGILSGISSGILSDIWSGISSDIFSGILSGISSDILSGISSHILSDILSGILSGISSDILSDIFSSRWAPAVPTAIWKSRLRSGSAHCDLEVAVEVRQCPLGSGARGGGPAVPTGIWTARRRRTRRRMRRRRRGEQLWWNLTTLTWQVGKISSCLGPCLGTLYSRWIVHPQLKGHFCHASEASQAGDTPQYLRPHPCDYYPPTQDPSQLGLYDDHARVKTKAMFNSYMLAMLYITGNQCKSTVLQQQLIVTVLMPHWKLEVCMYVYLVGGFNSSEKY